MYTNEYFIMGNKIHVFKEYFSTHQRQSFMGQCVYIR